MGFERAAAIHRATSAEKGTPPVDEVPAQIVHSVDSAATRENGPGCGFSTAHKRSQSTGAGRLRARLLGLRAAGAGTSSAGRTLPTGRGWSVHNVLNRAFEDPLPVIHRLYTGLSTGCTQIIAAQAINR